MEFIRVRWGDWGSCRECGCSLQDDGTWSLSDGHKHREEAVIYYHGGKDVPLEEPAVCAVDEQGRIVKELHAARRARLRRSAAPIRRHREERWRKGFDTPVFPAISHQIATVVHGDLRRRRGDVLATLQQARLIAFDLNNQIIAGRVGNLELL